MLSLLESLERDGQRSQRRLASEFGIALGLVNAYLKRCIKKGLVKVREAPARRYTYYLTPQGFAEKSRLTVQYLAYSLTLFRRAREDCTAVLEQACRLGWKRVVLVGVSDLTEISAICAIESGITIVGIVDPTANLLRIVGLTIFTSFDSIEATFDGVVVTDVHSPRETFDAAVGRFGVDRVLAPSLLGLGHLPARDMAHD